MAKVVMLIKSTVRVMSIASIFLSVTPLFTQQGSVSTNNEKNIVSMDKNVAEPKVDRLPAYNPFFIAYKNQWYVEGNGAWQKQTINVDMPSQVVTISGITGTISAGGSETSLSQTRVGGEVRYGITDRIIAGVSALYLVKESTSTTYSGSLSTLTTTPATARSGFYNPWFSLYGRLLGLDRNSWYLDVKGTFSPGIKSSDSSAFSRAQAEIDGGFALGRNVGAFTYGLGAQVMYSPEATNNGTTYRSTTTVIAQAIVQYELGQVFVEGLAGLFKYVDTNSANDPLVGKARTILQGSVGAKLQENIFIKGSFGWLMPVSTDYSFVYFSTTVTDKGGPIIGITVGAAF